MTKALAIARLKSSAPLKIAIWLQLQPGQELIGEGIGTHLARLLTGSEKFSNVSFVFCAPTWAKEKIEEYIWQYEFKVKIETKYFGPPYRKNRLEPKIAPAKKMSGAQILLVRRAMSTASFAPSSIILLFALLSILAAPIIFMQQLTSKMLNASKSISSKFTDSIEKTLSGLVYNAAADYIDREKSIVGCIVPIGNWQYCQFIQKKPVVAQVPDIVFLEFPEIFDKFADVAPAASSILRTSDHCTCIICPSEHVRKNHHIALGISPLKSRVVLHAPMTLDHNFAKLVRGGETVKATARRVAQEFLDDTNFGTRLGRYIPPRMKPHEIRKVASRIRRHGVILSPNMSLQRFAGSTHWLSALAKNWDAADAKLYFASQNRPYKNIFRTLLAIEELKASGRNIVLILTGDIAQSPEIVDLIINRDLYAHVLPLPRLNPLLHAAMYGAADISIAPSLFEGGFPFLFTEAMSIGTPSIMARIPATAEILPEHLWSNMTFDPRDISAIRGRIEYSADNTEELFEIQKPFYNELIANRDWSNVAEEYILAVLEGDSELLARKMAQDHKKIISRRMIESMKKTGFIGQNIDTDL
jgi:glycosyltransferase involved in cell wall biosynthesis